MLKKFNVTVNSKGENFICPLDEKDLEGATTTANMLFFTANVVGIEEDERINAMREKDGFFDAEKIAQDVTPNCSRRSRTKDYEPANFKGANDGEKAWVICDSNDDLAEGIKADFYMGNFPCIIVKGITKE